jgi:hypothetical protein
MRWMILTLLLLIPSLAEAVCGGSSPTFSAVSPGRTDVTDCITAAVDGDTINIPAGTATWSSAVTITNKAVSLIGAGIGQTIIDVQDTVFPCGIHWITHSNSGLSPDGFTRLGQMTIKSTAGCVTTSSSQAMIGILGFSHNVRLDHLEMFTTGNVQLISIGDDVRGVGDHNTFSLPLGTLTRGDIVGTLANRHLTAVNHDKWGNIGIYGDNSWGTDSSFGTADAWYWEDNTFDNALMQANGTGGSFATDDSHGARVVYRFNTWHNTGPQTHGTESNGRARGNRHAEEYRNVINWDMPSSTAYPAVFAHRGGTYRHFDNAATVTSGPGLNHMVTWNTYRRAPAGVANAFFTFGACGVQTTITSIVRSGGIATVTTSSEHYVWATGTYIRITGSSDSSFNVNFVIGTRIGSNNSPSTQFTYPNAGSDATATGTPVLTSPFDGNTDSTGYRCIDQLGAGKSILYSGDLGSTFAPFNPAANGLEPTYAFHNFLDGSLSAGLPVNAPTDVMVNLWDYYNENTSFNGTTHRGIGRGTRQQRDISAPTASASDGWWSTNGGGDWNTSTTETYSNTVDATYSSGADGCLDIWVGSAWVNCAYTPFTYPHPLIVDAGGGVTPPPPIRFAPGINLRRAELHNELHLVHQ